MIQNGIDFVCVFVFWCDHFHSVTFFNHFTQFVFSMKKHFYIAKIEYFRIVNKYYQFKYTMCVFFGT